jgi:hypothetical protein
MPRIWSLTPDRQLQIIVEIETGESVNHLEALAVKPLRPIRAAFHLYVPAAMVDVARRLTGTTRSVAEIAVTASSGTAAIHALHRNKAISRRRAKGPSSKPGNGWTGRAGRSRSPAAPARRHAGADREADEQAGEVAANRGRAETETETKTEGEVEAETQGRVGRRRRRAPEKK